jgi:signal transduction histidine kinase
LEVLQNLVDNAVKFAGDQPEPRLEIGAREEGEETIFFVRDNGIGIDPRYHQKVFGLFERLSADTEGTGIGLALVKRIIEVHGGRIWVESEAGQGTAFCFTLPQEDEG